MDTFYGVCSCGRSVLIHPTLTDNGPEFKMTKHRIGTLDANGKPNGFGCQERKRTKCMESESELPRYGVAS